MADTAKSSGEVRDQWMGLLVKKKKRKGEMDT